MKTPLKPAGSCYAGMLLLLATLHSCDQSKKANADPPVTDSASVKKMGTDSNSEMPVYAPVDSAAKIPNPYDSTNQ